MENELIKSRNESAVLSGLAVIVFVVIFWILGNFVFKGVVFGNDLNSRIFLFASILPILILPFLLGISWVASKRFLTSAIDPLSKNSQGFIEISSRYTQNTLEQTILALFAYFSMSIIVPQENLRFIPALLIIFLLGRITFAIGYNIKSTYRYFGFQLTFLPTILSIFYLIYLCFENIMTYIYR